MKDKNGARFSFTKREIVPFMAALIAIGIAWGGVTWRQNALAKDSKENKVVDKLQTEDIVAIKTDVTHIKVDVVDIKKEQLAQTKLLYKIIGALEDE